MPLIIEYHDQLSMPVILCDHCGLRIERAADGNYQWPIGPYEEGTAHGMVFTHKDCCHAFEQRSAGGSRGWGAMDLECLPYFLANNLGVTWRQARAHAQGAEV